MIFFFQAEDGIRYLVRSRGLGDVYKRQAQDVEIIQINNGSFEDTPRSGGEKNVDIKGWYDCCLLYTSDAADERSSVDLGGRRIIKKKKKEDSEHVGVSGRKKQQQWMIG